MECSAHLWSVVSSSFFFLGRLGLSAALSTGQAEPGTNETTQVMIQPQTCLCLCHSLLPLTPDSQRRDPGPAWMNWLTGACGGGTMSECECVCRHAHRHRPGWPIWLWLVESPGALALCLCLLLVQHAHWVHLGVFLTWQKIMKSKKPWCFDLLVFQAFFFLFYSIQICGDKVAYSMVSAPYFSQK